MEKEDFFKQYANHLNPKQAEAVKSVNGPILLLAVPGSGKTTVLVHRLGYMIFCEKIAPENILTLTYTVSATKDMAARFEQVFGPQMKGRLEFRTINGICAKIIQHCAGLLGQTAFSLVTKEGTLIRMLGEILRDLMEEYPTESDIKTAKTWITYCKNMLLEEEEIRRIGKRENIPLWECYTEYNARLRAARQMDYDDQMVYAYRLLQKKPTLLEYYRDQYRYICVDEAQDTSRIQHLIIALLTGKNGNLFMVGDEDQSIYGFRAAYPEALLHFEKDHPKAKVLIMDQNYRSNACIVNAADNFIKHNKERHPKSMLATHPAASPIRYVDLKKRSGQYSYLAKVAADCSTETAVLYRDNESALPLIDRLERQGIPFRIKSVDMSFFTHRIVQDVCAILRFSADPCNEELFLRIYYKCQTYLKKQQALQLCRISRERHIPIPEAAEYLPGLNATTLGKCRALATNLRLLRNEAPAKALFRIENPMGYSDYLERNGINTGKLFILKQLAYEEESIDSFLERLAYLQEMLKKGPGQNDCPFILSTIHSSKGLEYERVYLMDVFDGIFPSPLAPDCSARERAAHLEEERRLFYVGMTRAKNELIIFRPEEESSRFLREITEVPGADEKKKNKKTETKRAASGKGTPYHLGKKATVPKDFVLIIGERVRQQSYGPGLVSDVVYDQNGKAKRFHVCFDDGTEKDFGFPAAFQNGMMSLIGEDDIPV